jgi:hypothetical protein
VIVVAELRSEIVEDVRRIAVPRQKHEGHAVAAPVEDFQLDTGLHGDAQHAMR